MLPTTIPPHSDAARTPPPGSHTDARSAGTSEKNREDQITQRVPVAQPQTPVATPLPRAPIAITTPPCLRNLTFSDSDSEWCEDDASAVLGVGKLNNTRRAPKIGETVLGFKLLSELGRGAFARVYLAQQESLANRPVAIKLTLRPTREAERLARLQHTNIVPIYSVHTDTPVQIICMPYLGRVTIADVIRAYRTDHPSRVPAKRASTTRAAKSTDTGSKRSAAKSDGNSSSSSSSSSSLTPVWTWTPTDPPPIVGDPVAVLQVLAQLAAGLQHAHDRGILHLDLKPANVLLADTGEPMLLDFNLSFDATKPERDHVGGTMPYMAIEQLLDMRHRGQGKLDHRTDLYSLGAMAYEMLTGTVPFAGVKDSRDISELIAARHNGPPPLRERNPNITPAVEAIIRKLLEAEPKNRYQSADELRTDIERQLKDLPLKYARESSARERIRKWYRRNPGLPFRMMIACLLGLGIAMGVLANQREEANARSAAVEHARVTRAALDTLRLDLVLPGDPTARERGLQHATQLLASYGLPHDANWQQRSEVRRLSESERGTLAHDLGELLVLVAHAKSQNMTAKPEAERQSHAADAWKFNRAALTCFPGDAPSPLVDRQAAMLAPVAGEILDIATTNPNAEPTNTRDRFLEAAFAISNGRYNSAIPLIEKVIEEQPNHAAAQFCLAFCRHNIGQYTRSLERYDAAQALLPKDPRPAFHRGTIYGLMKRPAQAEAEFTKAIQLAPTHAEAYRCRGLARLRNGATVEAESDFTQALALGGSPLHAHLLRAMTREGRNPIGTIADRIVAQSLTPTTELDFLVRGRTRAESDPVGALADFRKAEELNPRSLVALQNQSHVLAEQLPKIDLEGALACATRVVELYPEFAIGYSGRAVILARLGLREAAHKNIEKALLLSEDAEVWYQAACVFSLTSTVNAADEAKAFTYLRNAIRAGYRDGRNLVRDSDLDAIRGKPDFRMIQQAVTTLQKE